MDKTTRGVESEASLFDVFRGVMDQVHGTGPLRVHPLFASLGASFPVDTYEDTRGLTVKADLPGVSKDKLKLSYQDRWLTIESERPCEADNVNAFIERPCGIFQRNIRLPTAIKPESISAKLQDGVLTVNMTKEKPGDSVTVRVD